METIKASLMLRSINLRLIGHYCWKGTASLEWVVETLKSLKDSINEFGGGKDSTKYSAYNYKTLPKVVLCYK